MRLLKSILSKLFLAVPALLGACSGSTEDVRLTLCKDLTQEFLDSPGQLEWASEDVVIKGYEDLEVRLKYLSGDTEGSFSCFYAYEAVEENATMVADPSAAFSTYPNRVMQNGQTLDHGLVAKKINAVMLKQGKQAIDAVKKQL